MTARCSIRRVSTGLALSATLLAGCDQFRPAPAAPATELRASGTVEATDVQLGFQATGRVTAITVREGDEVRAGDELARLDRSELEARRAQAVAQVATARAVLADLESGARPEEIAQARSASIAVRERLLDAERDRDRIDRLFAGGAVSREALDKATTAVEIARTQVSQADEQQRLLEAGPRPETIAAQRAQIAQAEAAVGTIDAALATTTIVAPFAGVVTVRHREPGEIAPPGAPVLTILNPDDRWVRIYIPEPRIGAVRLRMAAAITTDTYPGKQYAGEVVFLASAAEFTPKTVQTTEERVRLVYAARIRILEDHGLELKPGMPADVTLDLSPQEP